MSAELGHQRNRCRIIQVAVDGYVDNAAGELIGPAATGLPTAQRVTTLVHLNLGDSVEMDVDQTSRSNLALRGIEPIDPLLELVWLGP